MVLKAFISSKGVPLRATGFFPEGGLKFTSLLINHCVFLGRLSYKILEIQYPEEFTKKNTLLTKGTTILTKDTTILTKNNDLLKKGIFHS